MYRTGIKIIFFPLLYIRSLATWGFSRCWPESLMSRTCVVFQGFCECYEVTSPLWVHTFTLRHSLLSAAKVPYVHTHFMSIWVGAQCCAVFCVFACGFSATMMLLFWKVGEQKWKRRRGDLTGEAMVTEPRPGGRCHPFSHVDSLLSLSRSLSPKLCDDSVRRMCILVDRQNFCLLPFPFTSRLDDHPDWATSSINLKGHSSAYVQEAAHPRWTAQAVTTQHWGWTRWKHSEVTHRRSKPYRFFIIKLILARTTTQRLFVLFHYKATK